MNVDPTTPKNSEVSLSFDTNFNRSVIDAQEENQIDTKEQDPYLEFRLIQLEAEIFALQRNLDLLQKELVEAKMIEESLLDKLEVFRL